MHNFKITDQIQRNFHPGDEWSYFKFYTGTQTADIIITDLILPVANLLKNHNLTDQWFFIRYMDENGWHVRFRLHHPPEQTGTIIQQVRAAAAPFIENKMVWKIQLETYSREIERYGSATMELAERYFHSNSEMVAYALRDFQEDNREDHRWLFALACIDATLTFFHYNLEGKLQLLQNMKESFAKEFRMDKTLKKQLDQKYRKYSEHIRQIMLYPRGTVTDLLDEIGKAIVALENHSIDMLAFSQEFQELKQKKKLQFSVNDLMYSYIHMLMNRLLKSKQRVQEMVAYDFLYRYYRSTIAQQKNAKKKKEKLVEA